MPDTVAAVVERELGRPPDEVDRFETGLLHETYAVRCEGRGYVLQFGGGESDRRDSLGRGVGCYDLLAEEPVPVPAVVTPEPRPVDGRRYVLVEQLPGSVIAEAHSPERARVAGRTLARVHDAVGFERPGRLRFEDGAPAVEAFRAGSHGDQVRADLASAAATFREGGMQEAAETLERALSAFGDRFPRNVDAVLCHGDFSPDNLLFEGDTLTGVLDFDRARAGHAHRDLARAATAFWMHDPGADWPVRASVYEGYREVRPLGAGFRRDEPYYRVETLAEAVSGMLALDALSSYEREFYAEAIGRAVGRALGDD